MQCIVMNVQSRLKPGTSTFFCEYDKCSMTLASSLLHLLFCCCAQGARPCGAWASQFAGQTVLSFARMLQCPLARQSSTARMGVLKVWEVGCERARILTLVQACAVAISQLSAVEVVGSVGELRRGWLAMRHDRQDRRVWHAWHGKVCCLMCCDVVIGDGQGGARDKGGEERRSASECRSGSEAGQLARHSRH